MRLSLIRIGLKPNDNCPYKIRKDTGRRRVGEDRHSD